MMFETIEFERAHGVATITVNRPEALNAVTPKMCDEFSHAWDLVRTDDDVRAIVIRAARGRAFSVGVDVKEAVPWPWPNQVFDRKDPIEQIGPKHNRIWKPVVCAVHGLVTGAGYYFLNEADIIICSDDAQFFDSHLTFGMTASVEPTGLLDGIGMREVLRMILLSNDERMSAETALRIGLVTEITSSDDLWSRADALAQLIATRNPTATQGSVKAIWEATDLGRADRQRRALDYVTIGNPISMAEVDRASVPRAEWKLR